MIANLLLHDAADVGIGGVSCQRKFRFGGGVLQRYRRDKEAFGLFKSHRLRVGPRQSLWVALQEVSERCQNPCTVGKKSAVKVYHAEESLQLLDVLRGGALFDCGGLLRRGGGTFRRNRVAKKFQGGDSKNTFFQIDGKAIGGKN